MRQLVKCRQLPVQVAILNNALTFENIWQICPLTILTVTLLVLTLLVLTIVQTEVPSKRVADLKTPLCRHQKHQLPSHHLRLVRV